MSFSNDVVLFEAQSIPMIGNLEPGYVIGLTDDGRQVCEKMANEKAHKEDIAEVDESLLWHLERGGFFEGSTSPAGIQSDKTAYLHVTSKCNLNCVGCYSRMSHGESGNDLSLPDIFKALDFLKSFGAARLVVSGGEPFLRDDLPQILQHAKQTCKIAYVDVVTNGTILDRDFLNRIQPWADRICISLDGFSSNTPAYIRREQRFDLLMKSVLEIQKAGIAAHILPTLHAMNMNDLDEYASLAEDMGATFSFSLLSAIDEDDDIHNLLPSDAELRVLAANIMHMKDSLSMESGSSFPNLRISVCKHCGLGQRSISIGPDGGVYPCHMMHFEEFRLGSILSDTVEDVLRANSFLKMTVNDINECAECELRYLCGGGCRARAYYKYGDVLEKDSYCALMKEFYRLLFAGLSNKEKREEV